MDHITIEPATSADALGITTVRRQTWLTTYPNKSAGVTEAAIFKALNRRPVAVEVEERIARMQNNAVFQTWVAKEGATVVGFTEAIKQPDRNKIGAFYILSAYQHQGLGQQLMHQALSWLGEDKEVYCEVVAYNVNALAFYRRFGFVENGAVHTPVAQLSNWVKMPEMGIMVTRFRYAQSAAEAPLSEFSL